MAVNVGPILFLALFTILILILGTMMEALAVLFVTLPVIWPSVISLGIDPLLIGVLYCIGLIIGTLTPPVCIFLYAGAGLFNVPATDVIKEVWPYLIALIAAALVILFIPELTLWLPSLYG